MDILDINDLTEIEQSALTDSDMLVVGTSSGAKKIKANSLGGGGADDFLVTFTLDNETGDVTSDKTFAQIAAAYDDGYRVTGVLSPESDIYMLFTLTVLVNISNEEMAIFWGHSGENGQFIKLIVDTSGVSFEMYTMTASN